MESFRAALLWFHSASTRLSESGFFLLHQRRDSRPKVMGLGSGAAFSRTSGGGSGLISPEVFRAPYAQDIFEFAHIAREWIPLQQLDRLPADGEMGFVIFTAVVMQKMLTQSGNVLDPFAQGRNINGNHIQAIKEIAAEAILLHQLFQNLIGGNNDPHVHGTFPGGTDAAEDFFSRNCSNLACTEASISPISFRKAVPYVPLKQPLFMGAGIGKGAFFMSEEFILQQMGWK